MQNYTGVIYNTASTQTGLFFQNGFGSAYFISGASYNGGAYDKAAIFSSGFNEKILETEGFIFFMKFQVLKINTGLTSLAINGNNAYLFTSDDNGAFIYGPTPSSFTISFDANVTPGVSNQPPYMNLLLANSTQAIRYRDTVPGYSPVQQTDIRIRPSDSITGIGSFNLLIYKDPSKNFTSLSAFTVYTNGYKYVLPGAFSYSLNHILVRNIALLYRGGFNTNEFSVGQDFLLYNFGLARTSMTPADFDLFVAKMNRYDNYWHLFEGETDTPNINQSDIICYAPMYKKFGGNSNNSSNSINFMYPKSTTKYLYSKSDNTSWLNVNLGPKNRWRKPYPPFDPYI